MLARLLLATVLALTAVPRPAAAQLGSGCSTGALFSSIECRISALLDWAKGGGPPVTVAKKIQKLLLHAQTKVTSANLLAGKHRYKPARARLGKADRNLGKVQSILGSLPTVRSRGLLPTATPAEAAAFCQGIRTDMGEVRSSLIPNGPILFGEICCLRVCIPTQADPSACAIVDAIPCTTPDCLITAACLQNECSVVPTAIGTTCAQLYANDCPGSLTCDAYNPTCVAP